MPLLEGRRAIVTGASAGLGAGIAHELVARGARVLMCSRDQDRLLATADQIDRRVKQTGPKPGVTEWYTPTIVSGDVTHADTAAKLIAGARESFGGLDILVSNAGGPPPGDFADLDDTAWTEAFNLIVLSVVRLVRTSHALLRESQAGRIVLNTSISGLRPVNRLTLSNTFRPALMGLVRHLANELAPDGILINAVAPGFFDTERSLEVFEAAAEKAGKSVVAMQKETVSRVPLKRQGEPAELGKLVAFLVSEENSYLTGQTLVADGGLLLAP
ncbi:SDR family oxidoreductase [Candidatus Eisenbacteria bacterium]|uniref:SDR family oxidoreductase n=1 Tax=Eiseniibacteriota bacterium TaxID=2212470 RepID=A0ABV6YHY9_UNCEI